MNKTQHIMRPLKPNAETYRLTAISKLMSADLAQARIEISKASELAPTWESVRYIQAVIDYYGTLVESAIPRGVMAWPLPIDESLVKVDSVTVSRLREAQRVFFELSRKAPPNTEERRNLETWYIATLFNDPAQKMDVRNACKTLLENDPTHYRVISWVLARNINIDLSASTNALHKRVAEANAENLEIATLAGCLLRERQAKSAIELLKKTRRAFRTQHDKQMRILWLVRSYLQLPNSVDAVRGLRSLQTVRGLGVLKEMIDEAILTKGDNWNALVKRYDRKYQRTKDPRYLFEACEQSGRHQSWKYIADHATELVQLFRTPQSIRLATISAYNDQQFQLCLRLLDDNLSAFPDREMPTELRRLRIQALQMLGVLSEALVDAERLSRDDPTMENQLALAQTLIMFGDLKGVASVAQDLAANPELSTLDSLRLSKLLVSEDTALSKRLWRHAVARGVSDDLVGPAIAQAFQLALDEEARPLLERMAELGKKGLAGFRLASLEEMIEEMRKGASEGLRIREMYERGEIPIHLMVDALKLSLLNFYHVLPESNSTASALNERFPLLIRHGGRSSDVQILENQSHPRLNLDVTSILLYEQLGILNIVENAFAPLRIPAALFPTLIIMKDKLLPIQPSEQEANQMIKTLVEGNRIACVNLPALPKGVNATLVNEMGDEWASLLEEVGRSKGYLVEYLPLQKKDRTEPPTGLSKGDIDLVVDIRAVVDSLRINGPLSETEFERAIDVLGSNGTASLSQTVPTQSRPLHIGNNIPGVFAKAGLLDAICNRYKVTIDKHYYDEIKSNLHQYEKNQKTLRWLGDLISRLNSCVREGVYEFIPEDHANVTLKSIGEVEIAVRPLLSLLSFKPNEDDILCIDDRKISSYLFRDNRPIVTAYEIIRELKSRKHISEAEFREIIIRMRKYRVCFLQLEKEELTYHVMNARIQDGSLVETNELITLRQYFAECFARGTILQKPKVQNEQQSFGEIHFLFNYVREVAYSLVSLWEESSYNETDTSLRGEWILTNLLVDNLAILKTSGMLTDGANEQYVAAVGIASLLSSALALKGETAKATQQRRRYFGWLHDRYLAKRFQADRFLIVATADALKRSLSSMMGSERKDIPKEIPIFLAQRFYDDLPEPLRNEITKDPDFLLSIGYSARFTTQLLGESFEVNEFYDAASGAINGRIVKIKAWDSEKEFEFQPIGRQNDSAAFAILDSSTGVRVPIANEYNDLLDESALHREEYLLKRRDWFDFSAGRRLKAVKEIAGIEKASDRIERAKTWQSGSMNIFYRNLFVKIRDTGRVGTDDLVPTTAESLTNYLRISGKGITSLEASAKALMEEAGPLEAIKRFACLPIELPKVIQESIRRLSEPDYRYLVKGLVHTYGSPIAKFHFLRILTVVVHSAETNRRLAVRALSNILDRSYAADFEALKSVLRWSEEELNGIEGFQGLPTWQRMVCAWAHANNVFSILRSLNVPTDWISGRFGIPRVTHLAFDRGDFWYDITHSRKLTRELFIVSGLTYALSDSAEQVLSQRIASKLSDLVFVKSGEGRSLNPAFLSNRVNALNSTGSFFASEVTGLLSRVVEPTIAQELTSANLVSFASGALSDIERNLLDLNGWVRLHVVFGDQPLPPELAERFVSAVDRIDLPQMFRSDPDSASFALLFVTQQVVHLKNESIKSQTEKQLIEVAKCFANGICTAIDDGSEMSKLARPDMTIIQAAQNLSVMVDGLDSRLQDFSRIVLTLADAWPTLLMSAKPIFDRLVEELPIAQAKYFWPIVIRCRAV